MDNSNSKSNNSKKKNLGSEVTEAWKEFTKDHEKAKQEINDIARQLEQLGIKMDRGKTKAVPAASGSKTAVKKDGRQPQPVVCPVEGCHETFSNNFNLNVHRRVVHQKELRYKCPDCGQLFGKKYNLDRHVGTVHQNVRLFVCGICQKAFGKKVNLQRHQKQVHDGQKAAPLEKKGPCPVCDSLFYFPGHVERHVERIHPEVAEEENL